MLPKVYRLPVSVRLSSFRRVSSPLFVLKYAPNNLNQSRFRMLISKKIDKRATSRNRMRRLLQTAIQSQFEEFPKGVDYLVIVSMPFETLAPEVMQTIILTLNKAK